MFLKRVFPELVVYEVIEISAKLCLLKPLCAEEPIAKVYNTEEVKGQLEEASDEDKLLYSIKDDKPKDLEPFPMPMWPGGGVITTSSTSASYPTPAWTTTNSNNMYWSSTSNTLYGDSVAFSYNEIVPSSPIVKRKKKS
jgi:hypothetical protein